MQNRDQIISLVEKNRQTLKNQGVKAIGLFGSYATNQANEESDLDFVVRLEKKTFDAYMNVKFFLEGLFKKHVDLVMEETIKPRLRETILNQVIYVQGL